MRAAASRQRRNAAAANTAPKLQQSATPKPPPPTPRNPPAPLELPPRPQFTPSELNNRKQLMYAFLAFITEELKRIEDAQPADQRTQPPPRTTETPTIEPPTTRQVQQSTERLEPLPSPPTESHTTPHQPTAAAAQPAAPTTQPTAAAELTLSPAAASTPHTAQPTTNDRLA